jgi:hypothetical protein
MVCGVAVLHPLPLLTSAYTTAVRYSYTSAQSPADWFPPKKATSRPASTAPPPSPLSPGNAGSPLFPDGIMSPAWVQRHTSVIPSVVLAFHELPHTSTSTLLLGGRGALGRRDPLVQQHQAAAGPTQEAPTDQALCSHILEMKRVCADRGIRFLLILVIQCEAENATVEERLGSIKRRCTLDRASLFILPRGGAGLDYSEFRATLARAVYEHSMSYYREHVRRIKKKRARINMHALNAAQARAARTLSNAGWLVRYEVKLGMFAEFLQDAEAAVRWVEVCVLPSPFSSSSSVAITGNLTHPSMSQAL